MSTQPPSAPAGGPPGSGTDRGEGGFVRRALRRLVLPVLKREFEAFESWTASVGERVGAVGERLGAVGERLGAVERGTNEAHRRLEARVTEGSAAIDDLRRAYLATRQEFEQVRDERLPELARRVDALATDAIGGLQREIELLRDARIPAAERGIAALHEAVAALQTEVEGVRDGRLPSMGDEQKRLHAAIELVQAEMAEVRDVRVARGEASLDELHRGAAALQASLEEVRDTRVARLETTVAEQQNAVEAAQAQLARLDAERLGHVEADLTRLQAAIDGVQRLAEELRDARLPALAGRTDALVDRLYEELTTTAGLVDRLIANEPLRVAAEPALEALMPEAVREASKRFLAEFRGSENEIASRVQEYVPMLSDSGPVLDLGCGRGELLAALRDAGVEARGVDSDAAMLDACRRLALAVEQADLLQTLRACPAGSIGAVTAIHVLEHLPAATWMSVIDAAAHALRKGGVLIVECPDPESLRVGGDLFWIDPTHVRPVHPEAVSFVMRAVGLTVERTVRRRPFPAEQSLRRDGQSDDVAELASRLDDWLSGGRDFVVIGRK